MNPSIIRSIESVLGKCVSRSGNEFCFKCPYCIRRIGREDKKGHLYANPTLDRNGIKGWFHCPRCGAAGPIYFITKSISKNVSIDKWNTFLKDLKNVNKNSTNNEQSIGLPRDYMRISKEMNAYKYLMSRGISDDQTKFYNIGIGTEDIREISKENRKYYAGHGRIVFPDFDENGDVNYWVARTYIGHKVKYKNPPVSKSDKIYNLHRVKSFSRKVVITEGVISAIRACDYAIATYGKEVTKTQIDMLVSCNFDEYIIAFDGDAWVSTNSSRSSSAFKLSNELSIRGLNVSVVLIPYGEDPASVDHFSNYLDRRLQFTLSNKLIMFMQ